MRIVICHSCWSWVPLEGESCPDCHRTVDLNNPDPSLSELEELFGTPKWRLGRVRCERKLLPCTGEFFGTTGGLMFLPEHVQLPNGALEATDEPRPAFWQLPRWWSFWNGLPRETATGMTLRPEAMLTDHVAERFLAAPGAVFVPQPQLIRAALRGRTWTVSRTAGQTLRLTALAGAEEARRAWREMLSRDPGWRELSAPAR